MMKRSDRKNQVLRHNAFALVGEVTFFYLGIVFASTTTILPGFVGSLTGSAVLVGLVLMLAEGAWRLPQLLVANWLSSKSRKKPYLTWAAALTRPAYLVLAIVLVAGAGMAPVTALTLFFVLHFVMYAALSIDSLVWWDVFAKAIPLERRGRILGASTALQGLLAVGAGSIITWVLGSTSLGFPRNYAVLFALSGVFLLVSLLCWVRVHEPVESVPAQRPSWHAFGKQVRSVMTGDRLFRRFLLVRLLAGFDGLALGFYILFAMDGLGLQPSMIGVLAAVQTSGGILGGVLFGWISERFGNHRLIQLATLVGLSAPVGALVLSILMPEGFAAYMVAWVFFAIGMFATALFVGFNSLAVELAPAGKRGIYIGIFNLASGLVIVWPGIGGWLLDRTSFMILFAATSALTLIAHVASWSLHASPARRNAAMSVGGGAPLLCTEDTS